MSYARFEKGRSDVYVYEDVRGHLECCGCHLSEDCFEAKKRSEMISHLKDHITKGHLVPDYAIRRLGEEISEIGDEV